MEGWFPVAWSHEIERKPRACRLSGRPLVIYRTEEGSVVAFDDRCPHRHAPLSQGKLIEGALQCPYHGWSFDQAGQCVRIPASLAQESIERAPPLTSWRVYEGMGLVWVAPQSGKLFTPWDALPEMQASMRDSQTTIEFEKLFEGMWLMWQKTFWMYRTQRFYMPHCFAPMSPVTGLKLSWFVMGASQKSIITGNHDLQGGSENS